MGEFETDVVNAGIAGTNIAIGKAKDFFAYLREPQSKAEALLYKALFEKKQLEELDIDVAAAALLTRKFVRRINNNKSVIEKANKQFEALLSKASQKEVNRITVNKVEDDWMDYFLDITSVISDEAIQEIFASLLVAESVKKGSVKKILLNRMALLDSASANDFYNLCQLSYTLTIGGEERVIPLVFHDTEMEKMREASNLSEKVLDEYFDFCPSEAGLDMLSELGFITCPPQSNIYSIYFAEESDAIFSVDDQELTIKGIYNSEEGYYQVSTGYAFFTQVGLSVCRAMKASPYKDLKKLLDAFVKMQDELR